MVMCKYNITHSKVAMKILPVPPDPSTEHLEQCSKTIP